MRRVPPLVLFALLIPGVCFAQTLSEFVGLFNVLVGLMLAAAFLLFGVGVVVWSLRLGAWPSYRTQGIAFMQWGVATLFTLIVISGIVEYIQRHTQTALFIIAVIVLLCIGWLIIQAAQASEKGKEDKGRAAH